MADKIYVIEGGKIVESGRHSQLMAEKWPLRKIIQETIQFDEKRTFLGKLQSTSRQLIMLIKTVNIRII